MTAITPGKHVSVVQTGIVLVSPEGDHTNEKWLRANTAITIPLTAPGFEYRIIEGELRFLEALADQKLPRFVLLWLYDPKLDRWVCIHLKRDDHNSECAAFCQVEGGPTDEGSYELVTRYWFDDDGLHCTTDEHAVDCDGPREYHTHSICAYDPFEPTNLESKRHPAHDELEGTAPTFLPFKIPAFTRFSDSQRDAYAEAAGY